MYALQVIPSSVITPIAAAVPSIDHGYKQCPSAFCRSSSFSRSAILGTRVLAAAAAAEAEGTKVSRRRLVKSSVLVCCAAMAEKTLESSSSSPASGSDLEALEFKSEGYNFWTWRDHKVHYVVKGEGHPILLIHGFGASVYHWRYNIPELAKNGFKVYAMDLMGFGWTEKALVDYNSTLWRDQVADFVKEVVKEPTVLVGNSIGGLTVLLTAATRPELVAGLALLNPSGQFESSDYSQTAVPVEETAIQKLITNVKTAFRRGAIAITFWQAKQPARVRSVLQSVYKDQTNVDDYLVKTIVAPADDPNAGEVYYRLMSQMLQKPSTDLSLKTLLSKLECPLLLLWGDLDPWMGASKADKMLELYPSATLKRLQAGHCPHDEVPEAANAAIIDWMRSFGQQSPA